MKVGTIKRCGWVVTAVVVGVGRVVQAETDFKIFKDTFCDTAGVLKKMQDFKKSDPNARENPVVDAIIDQGGSGAVRLCNIFERVNGLVNFIDPRSGEQPSMLAIAKKLNEASQCFRLNPDQKKRDACFAESVGLTYKLIKPFIKAFLGEIGWSEELQKNAFFEGALFHAAHVKELVPPKLLGKSEKVESMLSAYEAALKKVAQFTAEMIFPAFDLIEQMSISLKSMSDMTPGERKKLTQVPPLQIEEESFDTAVKDVDSTASGGAEAELAA